MYKKLFIASVLTAFLGLVCKAALAVPASTTPAPLVSNGDFAAPLTGTWLAGGKKPIGPRIVEAKIEGAPHVTKAIQISLVAEQGANPWDAWLKAPNAPTSIAKGDMLGVHFWARSTQIGRVNAVYQQSIAPFEKTIRQTVSLKPEWQKFVFFATAGGNYPVSASNFELQLGQASGDVEVTGVRVENFGPISIADAQKKMTELAATVTPPSAPDAAVVPTPSPTPPFVLRPRQAPPYVVLKLDDVGATGKGAVPPRWVKVADFLKERKIKAAFGVITNSLEGNKPQYVEWLKGVQATGLIEFWDHGYDHKEWKEGEKTLREFQGTTYEQQKDHFQRSQTLFKEKLGFPLETFGAPFNATDENTVKAIAEIPELKIWLYADPKTPAGKVVMVRPPWLGIEDPIFQPNLDRFLRPYNNASGLDCLVIQGHPNMWDDGRFANFVKVVDFLTDQKAVFTTPTEYARLKNLRPN